MIFRDIYILLSLAFAAFLIGCSSGEYDSESTEVQSVDKTLRYDTLQRETPLDTTGLNRTPITFTFIVQVGAFREIDNFERFFAKARTDLGGEVYSIFINGLNKIRIGKYDNKADALVMLEKVKSLGYWDSFIVTVVNK